MSDHTDSFANTSPSADLPTPTRRAVFAGVGAVGAVAALAACGSDGPDSTNPSSTPGSNAAGGSIAKIADIPVGGGRVFPDANVVITQPSANVFVGFSSICTHQSCVLSGVSDGKINCACHFSAFDITTGEVVSPPATKPLPTRELVINGEEISLK